MEKIELNKAAAVLGRKGGSSKSDRKAKTSASNGLKGGRPKMIKIKWVVWSGEGECGNEEIKIATLQGIKRILTQERCGGDRFAHACPAHWPQAEFCASAREFDLNDCTENDMKKMYDAQNEKEGE